MSDRSMKKVREDRLSTVLSIFGIAVLGPTIPQFVSLLNALMIKWYIDKEPVGADIIFTLFFVLVALSLFLVSAYEISKIIHKMPWEKK